MKRQLLRRLRNSLSLLALLFLSFIFNSCSRCEACLKNESLKIPVEVLEKANAFVESKVGIDFFRKNIQLDYERCTADSPYYEMHYRMRIKGKDYIDEDISFTMNGEGRVVFEREITGLPECISQPETCSFNIDRESAVKIAQEQGLKKGIRDWDTSFRWDESTGQYIWHILATLSEGEATNGKRANGEEILIDPNDGSVIRKNEWFIR